MVKGQLNVLMFYESKLEIYFFRKNNVIITVLQNHIGLEKIAKESNITICERLHNLKIHIKSAYRKCIKSSYIRNNKKYL